MEEKVKEAIAARSDIPGFDALIARLKSEFEGRLGVSIELDRDRNYSASNRLRVYLDREGRPVPERSTVSLRMANFIVSARGKFYTVMAHTQTEPRYWDLTPTVEVASLIEEVSEIFSKEGIERLEGDVLDEIAPGHRTEFDNAPATVFQVLFGEIV